MKHLRNYAAENKVVWEDRSEQIVAFGKWGCCCRIFREYTKDPAVVGKFDYKLEIILMEWRLTWDTLEQ